MENGVYGGSVVPVEKNLALTLTLTPTSTLGGLHGCRLEKILRGIEKKSETNVSSTFLLVWALSILK